MMHLLLAGWILISAGALGRVLLDLMDIKTEDPWIDGLFAIGLGTGIWAFLIFSLGNIGLLYPSIGLAFLVLTTLAGIFIYRKQPIFTKLPAMKIKSYPFSELALLTAMGFLLILNISGALTPELRQDSLQYHVTVPHLYLQYHQIFDIPYLAYHFYSLNMEMIYTLGMMLDNTLIPKLLHLSMGFMSAILIWRIAKKESSQENTFPLLAAFLFYSLPQSGWMASTAYNENGWMFYGLLAFAAWLKWEKTRYSRWLCLSALMAGIGMSIKMISFAFYPLIIGAWTLLLIIRTKDKPQYKCWIPCGFILFLPLLPWFIRNLIYTGNPVFPLLGNVFPSYLDYRQAGLGFSNIRHMQSFSLAGLPGKSMEVFSGILINGNWMIALFFVCLGVGLCLWKHLTPLTRKTGIWGVIAWFIYLALEGGLDGRFLYPTYPIMAYFCAMVCKEAFSYKQGMDKVLIPLLALLLSIFSVFGRLGYTQDLNESLIPVLSEKTKDAYLERLPVYSLLRFINQNTPEDARILLPAGYSGVYCNRHYMANSEFDPSPLSTLVLHAKSADEIVQKLDEIKITHVAIPASILINHAKFPAIQELTSSSGKLLYRDSWFALIEIQPHHDNTFHTAD